MSLSHSNGSPNSRPSVNEDSRTERKSIKEIPMCAEIGYKAFGLPNIFDQDNTSIINAELKQFYPLIATQCSNILVHLLCFVYTPFCYDMLSENGEIVTEILPPCRNMCEHVREGCIDTIKDLGRSWPQNLNCTEYPEYKEPIKMCVGVKDPSTLPPIEVHTEEGILTLEAHK